MFESEKTFRQVSAVGRMEFVQTTENPDTSETATRDFLRGEVAFS